MPTWWSSVAWSTHTGILSSSRITLPARTSRPRGTNLRWRCSIPNQLRRASETQLRPLALYQRSRRRGEYDYDRSEMEQKIFTALTYQDWNRRRDHRLRDRTEASPSPAGVG